MRLVPTSTARIASDMKQSAVRHHAASQGSSLPVLGGVGPEPRIMQESTGTAWP